jgi:hypothetical protein
MGCEVTTTALETKKTTRTIGVSIREQIFVAIQTLLEAAGGPAGLTVHRQRTRPIEEDTLPAILIYADDDAPKPLLNQQYNPPLTERQMMLVCECRAKGTLSISPDEALDPLLVWATQQIMQNQQFGGLANGADEQRTVWNSREGNIPVAAAGLHFLVKYRTATTDPAAKNT